MIELDFRLPLSRFPLDIHCILREKVTAIVGQSGAGKTSLIESIAARNGDGARHASAASAIASGVTIAVLIAAARNVRRTMGSTSERYVIPSAEERCHLRAQDDSPRF